MAEENKKPFLDLPVYIGLHIIKQSMLRKKVRALQMQISSFSKRESRHHVNDL